MVRSDLPPSALNHFVASADQCLVLAAVFSGLMIATYWLAMCLVGRSLIGPVVRPEKHITRTCEGISVDRLQVRKKDYLYRAVSLIDQLLESRRQPPVPGEGGAAGCLH
jgi:hypothetical protein